MLTYRDQLWMDGKALCCDCLEEIDESRIINTEFGREVCEICAVKCSICENSHSEKDVITIRGTDYCLACKDHLRVIWDDYFKVYLFSHSKQQKIYVADKSNAMVFRDEDYAEDMLRELNNNRFKIQKI